MARVLKGRRDGHGAQEWMFCACFDACPPDVLSTRGSLSVQVKNAVMSQATSSVPRRGRSVRLAASRSTDGCCSGVRSTPGRLAIRDQHVREHRDSGRPWRGVTWLEARLALPAAVLVVVTHRGGDGGRRPLQGDHGEHEVLREPALEVPAAVAYVPGVGAEASRMHGAHGSLAHAWGPDRHGAHRQRRRRLHDRAHKVRLVVELLALQRGQLAQRFDRDGELPAGAPLVPQPAMIRAAISASE